MAEERVPSPPPTRPRTLDSLTMSHEHTTASTDLAKDAPQAGAEAPDASDLTPPPVRKRPAMSPDLVEFLGTDWQPAPTMPHPADGSGVAGHASRRRQALSEHFAGQLIVVLEVVGQLLDRTLRAEADLERVLGDVDADERGSREVLHGPSLLMRTQVVPTTVRALEERDGDPAHSAPERAYRPQGVTGCRITTPGRQPWQ